MPVFLAKLVVPGGAFLSVAEGIYATVMTFVEKGKQIASVGAALFDSISQIAAGQLAPAAGAVEGALVRVLPVALGFLAKWLHLDGIVGKIQTGLNKVKAPVQKAVSKVLDKVAEKAAPLWARIQAGVGKVVDKGKALVGLPTDPQARLQAGLQAAANAVQKLPGNLLGEAALNPVLAVVKATYGFQELEPYLVGDRWYARGRVNPAGTLDLGRDAAGNAQVLQLGDAVKIIYIDGM